VGVTPKFLGGPNLRPTTDFLQAIYMAYNSQHWDLGQTEILCDVCKIQSHPCSELCTGSRSMNALNINSCHSPIQSSYSQPDYLHNLISVQSIEPDPHSVVTLARPSVSSSLQITNRSFRYASPYLWNQLPSSFRQPHSVHFPPGSPHPAHITSPQSSPSLLPSVTPSTFHSRLKTHLFHKCFPP